MQDKDFVEIDVLIDDAAELAAEAVCACGCGMGLCSACCGGLSTDDGGNG